MVVSVLLMGQRLLWERNRSIDVSRERRVFVGNRSVDVSSERRVFGVHGFCMHLQELEEHG